MNTSAWHWEHRSIGQSIGKSRRSAPAEVVLPAPRQGQSLGSSAASLPHSSRQPKQATAEVAASDIGTKKVLRRLVPCRRSAPAEMMVPVPEDEEASSGSSDNLPPPGTHHVTPHCASPVAAPRLGAYMMVPSGVGCLPAAMPLEQYPQDPADWDIRLTDVAAGQAPQPQAKHACCATSALFPGHRKMTMTMSATAGAQACSPPCHATQERAQCTLIWVNLLWPGQGGLGWYDAQDRQPSLFSPLTS